MYSPEGNRFLPLPDITYSKEKIDNLPLIVLCGYMGSGKGTGATYLQKKFNFSHEVASHILREHVAKLGTKDPSRSQLDEIGQAIEQKYGSDGITRMVLARIDKSQRINPTSGVIIDGLRHKEEVEYLQQFPLTKILWLDAQRETRFSRIVNRGRENDLKSWEEFLVKDTQETQWMKGIKELSTEVIDADNSEPIVEQELRRIILKEYDIRE